MQLKITIDMDNAAFEDDTGEAARILKVAGDKIERHLGYAPDADFSCKLQDINGNTVGDVLLTDTATVEPIEGHER